MSNNIYIIVLIYNLKVVKNHS